MSDLIKITTKDGKQLVSARELHDFLEIKTEFRKWFPRMCEYGFVENVDFTRAFQKCPTLGGIQTVADYAITIDMAKEISMIQRTEKGKQARLYFIECEKKLKEVDVKANLLLSIYNGGQEGIAAAKKLTELEVEEATKPLLPKVEYHDKVLNPTDEENGFTKLLTTTEVAKDLGMNAKQLNNILHEKRIIYKQGKTWVLYSKYNYLISEKYCDYFINEFGNLLKWTEKGRKFIIELLNKQNKQ